MVPGLLAPIVVAAALLASASAFAGGLGTGGLDGKVSRDFDCDEMSLVEAREGLKESGKESGRDVGDANLPSPSEVVIPCAMAESGTLGPACQDAAFYVVNNHGTLLCRVDLAVFTQAGSAPMVEQAPATPSADHGPITAAAAVVPALPDLPPRGTFRERHKLGDGQLLGPADAHLSDRPRPS